MNQLIILSRFTLYYISFSHKHSCHDAMSHIPKQHTRETQFGEVYILYVGWPVPRSSVMKYIPVHIEKHMIYEYTFYGIYGSNYCNSRFVNWVKIPSDP